MCESGEGKGQSMPLVMGLLCTLCFSGQVFSFLDFVVLSSSQPFPLFIPSLPLPIIHPPCFFPLEKSGNGVYQMWGWKTCFLFGMDSIELIRPTGGSFYTFFPFYLS